MNELMQIVGTSAYIVRLFPSGSACFFTKAVNPKTGKPWQAGRNDATFHGDRAHGRALRHWLYQITQAKKPT